MPTCVGSFSQPGRQTAVRNVLLLVFPGHSTNDKWGSTPMQGSRNSSVCHTWPLPSRNSQEGGRQTQITTVQNLAKFCFTRMTTDQGTALKPPIQPLLPLGEALMTLKREAIALTSPLLTPTPCPQAKQEPQTPASSHKVAVACGETEMAEV